MSRRRFLMSELIYYDAKINESIKTIALYEKERAEVIKELNEIDSNQTNSTEIE